ncbi:fanconi complementation group d2, partial [Lasius niger]
DFSGEIDINAENDCLKAELTELQKQIKEMQQQLTTAVAANKLLQQQPSTSALHVCKVTSNKSTSIPPEQPPSTTPEQLPEQPPEQPRQQIETARTQPAEIQSESTINNIMRNKINNNLL